MDGSPQQLWSALVLVLFCFSFSSMFIISFQLFIYFYSFYIPTTVLLSIPLLAHLHLPLQPTPLFSSPKG